MADIVAMPGAADPVDREPVAKVVERLEWLLERAKRGEIRCLGFAVVNLEGTTGDGWAPGRGPYSHELMASITDLQFRYARFRYENDVAPND